jgi:hypothetical protein
MSFDANGQPIPDPEVTEDWKQWTRNQRATWIRVNDRLDRMETQLTGIAEDLARLLKVCLVRGEGCGR